MSDPIFEPFEPTPAPPAAGEPEKRNRRQRGNGAKKPKGASRPQTAKPAVPTVAEDIRKEVKRKRRTANKKPATARGLKLDIHTILPAVAGMKPEDAHLFSQMVSALQKSNKKARVRIVAALGKVFA